MSETSEVVQELRQQKEIIDDLRSALLTVLDCIDYTAGACGLTEMVGAALPKEVIALAKAKIRKSKGEKE